MIINETLASNQLNSVNAITNRENTMHNNRSLVGIKLNFEEFRDLYIFCWDRKLDVVVIKYSHLAVQKPINKLEWDEHKASCGMFVQDTSVVFSLSFPFLFRLNLSNDINGGQ